MVLSSGWKSTFVLFLFERYNALDETDTEELRSLQDEFYKIGAYHFNKWGIVRPLNKDVAREFEGNYKQILCVSFPKLKLFYFLSSS